MSETVALRWRLFSNGGCFTNRIITVYVINMLMLQRSASGVTWRRTGRAAYAARSTVYTPSLPFVEGTASRHITPCDAPPSCSFMGS